MQPDGEYSAAYYQPYTAAPHPGDFPTPRAFASAPPFAPYSSADCSRFLSAPYPSYPHNPEPSPPAVPSHSQPPVSPPTQSQIPHFQTYGASASAYLPPPVEQPTAAFPAYSHLQQAPATPSVPHYSYENQQSTSSYAAPRPQVTANPSPYSSYENSYGNPTLKFDQGGGGYFGEGSVTSGSDTAGIDGHNSGGFERDSYDKRAEAAVRFDRCTPFDGILGDGVYAYDGGRLEPYGARGTAPARFSSSYSSSMMFDDYGRSVVFSPAKEQIKIVKAVPKVETQQDAKSGVQKFRLKLLPEGSGQSAIDVICQIGLDGIRMLEPSTNRTLRIYPIETVTRSEVTDSSVFTFWSKSSVDLDARRIRLQSNSYTINSLLDIVTATTIQYKEMGIGRNKASQNAGKQPEQSTERKKGFTDWISMIKPANEEKDHWVPDEAVTKCTSCEADFGAFFRKHHCRNCGDIFCDKCTSGRIALTADEQAQPVRVCGKCMEEVTRRLNNAKEMAKRPPVQESHEDLSRKLQEEMEKNRRAAGGSKTSNVSTKRMREVACPTCTVHLQVKVPSTGSATVECGVCQHPFLVNAK